MCFYQTFFPIFPLILFRKEGTADHYTSHPPTMPGSRCVRRQMLTIQKEIISLGICYYDKQQSKHFICCSTLFLP